MNNVLQAEFISKRIPISLEGRSLSSLPKIIRSHELEEIHQVQALIDAAKLELEEHKRTEMNSIEERRIEIERSAREDVLQQAMQSFDEFKNYKEQYFSNIEEHCAAIVKKTISTILADVVDTDRVRLALESVIQEVKGQTDVVIKVNPRHEQLVTKIASDRDWKVKFDSNFPIDECQLDVPLGAYRSSFTYQFEQVSNALSEASTMDDEEIYDEMDNGIDDEVDNGIS